MTVTIMEKIKHLKTRVEIFKSMGGGNILGGSLMDGNFPGRNFPDTGLAIYFKFTHVLFR